MNCTSTTEFTSTSSHQCSGLRITRRVLLFSFSRSQHSHIRHQHQCLDPILPLPSLPFYKYHDITLGSKRQKYIFILLCISIKNSLSLVKLKFLLTELELFGFLFTFVLILEWENAQRGQWSRSETEHRLWIFVTQTQRQHCNRILNASRLVILHSPVDLEANKFPESPSPLAV